MHSSHKLLGIIIACLFIILFVLQASTGIFSPNHPNALSFASRPLQQSHPVKQSSKTKSTVITGGGGGVNIPRSSNALSKQAKTPDLTYPPDCNGLTSTPTQLFYYLGPGWTVNNLGAKYRNMTDSILCYDHWNPAWSVPGGTWMNITDFLKTMQWPSDLFDPSAGTQILVMSLPGDSLGTGTSSQDTTQNQNPCIWSPDLVIVHPNIDVCGFVSTILDATILAPLKGAVTNLVGSANSFLWTTPPQDTYLNPSLTLFWTTSLYIVDALLAAVLAWAAFRYMISKTFGSWLSYADLLEMLPRIVMALIAAYLSARICQIVIDGSNALSSVFNNDLLSGLQNNPQDLFTTFVQILLCLLTLALILEEAVRYAILFILIGFAPIWVFCGALKETQFIFKGALKALFLISLLQPCQTAVLDLGQHLTDTIGGTSGTFLYYLISIALMLFVLFMMSWFLRASGISSPFGIVGAGAVALGTRAISRGIAKGTKGAVNTVKNSPRLASAAIHTPMATVGAGVRAYQAVRATPRNIRTGIGTVQARMSKAYQSINTARNRMLGISHLNPPPPNGTIRP
jgi:hypothetical protein